MNWFLYDNGLRHERVKSCSVNKLKSHMLFTFKNVVFRFYVEKNFLLQELVGVEGLTPPPPPPPPFLYGPDRLSVLKKIGISKHLLKSKNIAEVNAVARDSCCKQCLIYYTHFSNQISPF